MKDEEILKKAIEKAVKGGYKFDIGNCEFDGCDFELNTLPLFMVKFKSGGSEWKNMYQIIFSHDFAFALWGGDYVDDRKGETLKEWIERTGHEKNWGCHKLRWQYHLQQMVLEKLPLKYLERFL